MKTAGHPPPVAALDFAIVHLAIYDAVESIDRRYEPYYTLAPGATGSLSAAQPRPAMTCWLGCSQHKVQRWMRTMRTSWQRTALIRLIPARL